MKESPFETTRALDKPVAPFFLKIEMGYKEKKDSRRNHVERGVEFAANSLLWLFGVIFRGRCIHKATKTCSGRIHDCGSHAR